MLVKVARSGDREELKRMADTLRGRVIDESDRTCTIELDRTPAPIDSLLKRSVAIRFW